MEKPFKIPMEKGLTAPAIRVESPQDLSDAIDQLNLHNTRPVLVIVGGAQKLVSEISVKNGAGFVYPRCRYPTS